MLPSRRISAVLAGVAGGVAIGFAGVTLATSAGEHQVGSTHEKKGRTPVDTRSPIRARAMPTSIPESVAAKLEIFRRSRTQSDAFPAGALPAADGVCFTVDIGGSFGGTCGSIASIEAGKVVLVTDGTPGRPDVTTLTGVVPDGVKNVTVRSRGGSQEVSVHENTFWLDVPSGSASVSWSSSNGTEASVDIPQVREPAGP
jgi:hypothetical protein